MVDATKKTSTKARKANRHHFGTAVALVRQLGDDQADVFVKRAVGGSVPDSMVDECVKAYNICSLEERSWLIELADGTGD